MNNLKTSAVSNYGISSFVASFQREAGEREGGGEKEVVANEKVRYERWRCGRDSMELDLFWAWDYESAYR